MISSKTSINPPRVLAYARASTNDQTHTIAAQLHDLRQWAQDRHCCSWFDYCSSTVPISERPGFTNLFSVMQPGDILAVTRLDRLTRSMPDFIYLDSLTRKLSCTIYCLSGEGNGTTPESLMIRQIMTAFAEYERRLISMRTSRIVAHLRSQGRVYGQIPYGYREENHFLIPHQSESWAICVISLCPDIPARFIRDALLSLNLKPRGSYWYSTSIRRLRESIHSGSYDRLIAQFISTVPFRDARDDLSWLETRWLHSRSLMRT